jgi:hypothetical protein
LVWPLFPDLDSVRKTERSRDKSVTLKTSSYLVLRDLCAPLVASAVAADSSAVLASGWVRGCCSLGIQKLVGIFIHCLSQITWRLGVSRRFARVSQLGYVIEEYGATYRLVQVNGGREIN